MKRLVIAPAAAMTFASIQVTYDGTTYVQGRARYMVSTEIAVPQPATAITAPFYVECEGASAVRFHTLSAPVTAEVTGVPFDGAGLLPARLNNDFVTLGGLGDSQLMSGVTESGTSAQDLSTGRLGAMVGYNCLLWASGYSGGKLVYNGIDGTTGITTATIRSTYLPLAMTRGWKFCCVSGGTNDIAGAVASATTIANMRAIVEGLLSVGTIPIIMGVLPNLVTLGNEHDELNIGYRKLANEYAHLGVIFEDAYAPHVETTGLGIAGHFRDNTHLTAAQNKVRGQRLATLILAAHPWVRDAYVPVSDATGKTGVFTNSVFTANSGAVTPTGWTLSGVGSTSNVAAGTAVGNEWTITKGANAVSGTTGTFAAGNYVFVGGMSSTNVASASSEIGFRDPAFDAAGHAWRWVIDTELPAAFYLAVKFSVPAGFPTNYFRQVNSGANPSNFLFYQMEVYPV